MTLHTANLSDSAIRTIQHGVEQLSRRPEYAERALAAAAPSALAVAAPHDVYTLGLEALTAGARLDAAERVGRRVLIMDDDRPVAAGELADPEGGGGFAATEGPFTEATARTIEEVEGWPVVADGEYELRVLRLPALYLMALWLKDRDGDADLLVPLDPAPSGIEAGKRYTESELLKTLKEQASARPASDPETSG